MFVISQLDFPNVSITEDFWNLPNVGTKFTSGYERSGYDDKRDYDDRDYDERDYDERDYDERDYDERDYDGSDYDGSDYDGSDYDGSDYDVRLSHYEPRSRMDHDHMYNSGIDESVKALDIIIIGSHFSLRGYSKTADAITDFLIRIFKDKVGDFALRDENKISYHNWLRQDKRGHSFWVFQRDPSKSIQDVENPRGWWNWALLKDCERKVGLLDYRYELMKKCPDDWPHLRRKSHVRNGS
ncbi:hypothetical protein MMC22_003161 [Lobaria immixta]|nr:hypothetical protein [Lobaria immixta]